MIVGWSAIFYSLSSDFSDPIGFFSYFTIQSNILIISWFTLAVFSSRRKKVSAFLYQPFIRSGLFLYIIVTMLVFFTLLFKSNVGLNFVTSYVLHLIMPLAYIFDWLVDRPTEKIGVKAAMSWLIYPLVYCVYTLIRGYYVGWYPYYFLSPIKMGSYGRVDFAVVGLTAFFVMLIWFVYSCHNRLAGHR